MYFHIVLFRLLLFCVFYPQCILLLFHMHIYKELYGNCTNSGAMCSGTDVFY